MKRVIALMAMALLISTCSAAFVPTEDDMKWLNSISSDSQVLVSDMNLISSAANDMNLIKTKTYCGYLKSDAANAMSESEKYIVSNELQTAKDYYELALKKFHSSASDIIDGIDASDESKLKSGTTDLQEGSRYINLALKEINAFIAPQ